MGSFTLDVQKSKIRDQDCFYVHQVSQHYNNFNACDRNISYIFIFLQSTVLKKRPGFENICHVTGFVTKDLDTLEERRLVIVRNNQQDDLHLESRPLFRGGKVIPK